MQKRNIKKQARRRQKVGTILNSDLYRDLKVYAARSGRPVADVVQDAIAIYLSRTTPPDQVIRQTYGVFAVPDRAFKDILEMDVWDA